MTAAPPLIRTGGDSAPPYSVQASPGFAAWLHAAGATLALTTYQIGKVFLIGAEGEAALSVSERTFERCLGIASDGSSGFVLAGLNAIWRFGNVVPPGRELEGHDAVYVPQAAWFTGDVFAHDVGVAPDGRPVFVNTLFSCIAAVDERSSFRPVWTPPFISALAPQDRCHLNGLAMDAAAMPRYATAAGETDGPRGWRENRLGRGVVLDIATGAVVCRGLTMPHSPRLHDGRLYVLNAGTGELGLVDVAAGRFHPLAFLPGFTRGLVLHGGHALVGLSLPRANEVFAGLPLDDRLKAEGFQPQCALVVVELSSGKALHWLRLGGVVRELYDVALLPRARRPMLVGMQQAGPINRLVLRGPDLALDALRRPS
jgi:uncharacterized protein (TIGR03032 family)